MTRFTGFVAMEYCWLILNRTFVVFVGSEGLYGWKAVGIVSAASTRFYEPLAKILEDPEAMEDTEWIKEMAGKRGGFLFHEHPSPRPNLLRNESGEWRESSTQG